MLAMVRVSSRTLSHWYPRLASAVEAGLGFDQCLENIPGPSARGRAEIARRLRLGDGLDAALDGASDWLPRIDRELMRAGANSGRLPDALRRLAARHHAAARAQVGILLAIAYPVALVHLGACAFPVQMLVDGRGAGAYALAVARLLVPLWVVAAAFGLAVRAGARPAIALLDFLPLVGGFRRARALADLAFALEALVVAGTRIDLAWLHAGMAAGDHRLEPVAIAAAESVQRGDPVSPVLVGRREIPTLFAEFYRTGEATGRLDEALRSIQQHFSDTAATKLRIVGMVYPAILFMLVAGWVAARVVMFYADYFRQIEDLTK